jgi:hypothetical protein
MSEKKPVPESDQTDPLTLTNLILNKDAKDHGFDWVRQRPGGPAKNQEDLLQNEPPEKAFITVGEYEVDPPVVQTKTEAMEQPNSAANSMTNTTAPGIEANNLDPTIVSTDPKFNVCPAYLQSMCRIDGRPCPYSNLDYKECGKYYLAGSGDPQLFEIPPGRETSVEYEKGIKQ